MATLKIIAKKKDIWLTQNPIINVGEAARCTDFHANRIRIGDGVHRWNKLPETDPTMTVASGSGGGGAGKWDTARDFSLAGSAVSNTVPVDGTANVVFNTRLDMRFSATATYDAPTIVLGSDNKWYSWVQANGVGTVGGVQDPVVSLLEDYWHPLANDLAPTTIYGGGVRTVDFHSPGNTRATDLAKYTNFSVPEYTVGNNDLNVYFDGVHVLNGANPEISSYKEIGAVGEKSKTIQFHDALIRKRDVFIKIIANRRGVDPIVTQNEYKSAMGTRTEIIARDTPFTVPEYTVGKHELTVHLSGLHCLEGTDPTTCVYKEVGTTGEKSTSISWHIDINPTHDISVLSSQLIFEAAGSPLPPVETAPIKTAITDLNSPSNTRTELILKHTNFTIPEYTVGNNETSVYLNGLFAIEGTDIATATYKEIGIVGNKSTTIQFHDDIKIEHDLFVRVLTTKPDTGGSGGGGGATVVQPPIIEGPSTIFPEFNNIYTLTSATGVSWATIEKFIVQRSDTTTPVECIATDNKATFTLSVTQSSIGKSITLDVAAMDTATNKSIASTKTINVVVTPANTVTPGGRVIYRHSSGMGSVIEFNDGQLRRVLVLDSMYRDKQKWGTYDTDMPQLTNYQTTNTRGDLYLNTSGTSNTNAATVMTDAVINSLWVNSIDNKTSKENCDIWMTKQGSSDSQGITGVPAVEHARSILVNGVGCDVPNVQTLMRLFLDANYIDALDPTAAANPTKALGSMNSGGYWNSMGTTVAWASSEYSNKHVRYVNSNGHCGNANKHYDYFVVPVQEL